MPFLECIPISKQRMTVLGSEDVKIASIGFSFSLAMKGERNGSLQLEVGLASRKDFLRLKTLEHI